MNQAKIISICNLKGGVGKTTSTLNIGAGLNKLGKKVLLIDLNPNANLSQILDVINPKNSIIDLINNLNDIEPYEIFKGFHIIPTTIELSASEIKLSSQPAREFYLKKIINRIKDSYDYILIDCHPSLGLLTINAFTASDQVIIPFKAEYLSLTGLTVLTNGIKDIKKRFNPDLNVGGIFLTQFDYKKILSKEVLKILQEYFSNEMFDSKIRTSVELAAAPIFQKDIFRYKVKCDGAKDYLALSNEILYKNENETSRSEKVKDEIRVTNVINKGIDIKIKAIAYLDRVSKKDIINEALENFISEYENKNGNILDLLLATKFN